MVPRSSRHAFRVDSETARFLNGYTPASMEALIVELATPTTERVLPPKGAVAPPTMNPGLLQRYGMDVLRGPDRIAKALIARGAAVRVLVRIEMSAADKDRLTGMGAVVAPTDVADVGSVAAACEGAACVVSTLNGLHDVIIDRQSVPLDGAVKAGVPRFISSDYLADFTKTQPGDNRNLDLRREFMARAGVRQAIEAAGASLLFIPPYSRDLNPIELAFAKLKALLRARKPVNMKPL